MLDEENSSGSQANGEALVTRVAVTCPSASASQDEDEVSGSAHACGAQLCAPRRRVRGVLPELLANMDQLFDCSLDETIAAHLVVRESSGGGGGDGGGDAGCSENGAALSQRQRRQYVCCERCENPSVSLSKPKRFRSLLVNCTFIVRSQLRLAGLRYLSRIQVALYSPLMQCERCPFALCRRCCYAESRPLARNCPGHRFRFAPRSSHEFARTRTVIETDAVDSAAQAALSMESAS